MMSLDAVRVSLVREHGGGLTEAKVRYGAPAEGWIDLSTGLNPWSYPVPEIPVAVWGRLPDADLYEECQRAACSAYGVSDCDTVVLAPGTQALLQILPFALSSFCALGDVAIVGPTYSEHVLCWRRLTRGGVREVETLEQAEASASVMVLVNPNNPDGRRVSRERVIESAMRMAARNGFLIVDEAFADVVPEVSVADLVGECQRLIVLRSFGKFYGLAGGRLGIALAHRAVARVLADFLGPWAVGGPTLFCGATALNDQRWREAMRGQLVAQADRFDALLQGKGLKIIGGTPLFRLATHPNAENLAEKMARQGILVRRFSEHPMWLRFGLPRTERESERLALSLA